ncbi:MAG: hypothetical protein B5M53_05295 [Candidatus Cloacimonas sp. 4484_209]|nr:MAG: hypothetical protein B5M53_05295 [Candidatus Cloacimonas sp. 4484_209]
MKVIILNSRERLVPRVALEAKTLKDQGYNITIVNWCRSSKDFSYFSKEQDGFCVKWIMLDSYKGSIKTLFSAPRLYTKIWRTLQNEEFDVIHCIDLFLLPAAIYVAKRKKAKIVYDAKERYIIYMSEYFLFLRGIMKKLIETLENFLVKHVDAVLTISTNKEMFEKRYKRFCRNVEVIYNVPDLSAKSDKIIIENLRNKYQGKYILAYAGELGEQKGLNILPEVIKLVREKFSQVLVLLIGNFAFPSYKEQFLAYIKKEDVEQNIIIMPWLPYDKMFQYLKISHVGLALYQPRESYKFAGKGCACKLFTYMHAGIPIISTNFGELAKVVKEENCGILVDTTSAQAIANAVIFLLKNKDIAREFGENGRRAILEKYNWGKESQKLLKIYKKILMQ